VIQLARGLSFIGLLAALTAGVVVGVSFIAQPVKFTAAGVGLAEQVRIGSVIFHASHKVQLALLLVLVAAVLAKRVDRLRSLIWLAVAVAALAAQWFWLMPLLDSRVAELSAGQTPAPNLWLHGAYVALEVSKLLALLALAWQASLSDRHVS
jgi:hypothetical protein